MKKITLTLTAIFFAFALKGESIVGTWNGTLSVMGHELRIVFNIAKDGETYTATMDSPDQGATGLPVSSVTLENNQLRMSISIPQAPPAEFTGEVSENTITGTFRQMGHAFPLNLTRAGMETGRGFLRGRLFDSQTREPLMFASVALLADADSSLLTGVITDEDGRFLLENLRDGHYRLRVSNVGHHTFVSETIELRRGNNRLDMGSFFINPSTIELAGVEIVAAVPLLEQRAGRLIFNVSESTTSVGDNALETLRKFPGVVVDNDDNITLSGRTVLVMIDNRETHLSGEQLANLLRTMPAEQIGSIEAIDNPGARFSAEGISGILNIRTRRTRMIGYSGTVFAGVRQGRDFSHNQGFDVNFRNNRLTAFANFSHSRRAGSAGMEGFTEFPDGSRRTMNLGDGESWAMTNPHHFISGRGGVDFHINSRNVLSASYRFMQGGNRNNGFMNMRMMDTLGAVESSVHQDVRNNNHWGNHNLSLNYQHIFDSVNQRQFFIDASWVRNYFGGGGNLDMNHYIGDIFSGIPGDIARDSFDIIFPSDIFSARFDLEFPITRETRIETGIRYSFVNNDNKQRTYNFRILDLNRTDHYVYTEHISAAYVQVNHSFSPRFSIEAGLRFEHTALQGDNRDIDGNSIENLRHTNNYHRFFPSLNVNKMLTDRSGLNFSYSHRLTRPHFSNLNPMRTPQGAFSFREGNPYLGPQLSHIFRLRYSFNHMPILTFAFERSDGDIHQISRFQTDTMISRPENIGSTNRFGLGLSYQHTFFQIWRVVASIDGNFSRSRVRYEENGEWMTRDRYNGWAWIGNDITLSPTMTLSVNGWGQLPQRGLFTSHQGMYVANVGFRKSFFDRSFTVALSVDDVFNTAGRWTNDTRLPTGQRDFSEFYWGSTAVSVRLSYRFGRGNVVTPRQRREAAAEEAGRMGGGDGGGGMGGM